MFLDRNFSSLNGPLFELFIVSTVRLLLEEPWLKLLDFFLQIFVGYQANFS